MIASTLSPLSWNTWTILNRAGGEGKHTALPGNREAAVFLRKIRRLLKQQEKDTEWESYLEKLRQDHIRKRRLMEILDGLEDKSIVKAGRK